MGKTLFTAVTIGLLVTFAREPSADSSQGAMFRANLQRTGVYSSEAVRELTELKWKFEPGDNISFSPAIAGGVVYFGSMDGHLYAVDSQTGKKKWTFETGIEVYSSPAVADGVVYFGSGDGYLYAVDSQTGKKKWKFKTEEGIASSPAIADGVVYFGSMDGHLYAVDSQTGKKKWKFKTEGGIASSPAIADGVVYFVSGDGYLYAVDIQTGEEKWKFEAENYENNFYSSPAIADGVVYFHSEEYLYAVDSQTGQKKWEFEAEGDLGYPAIANEIVCISSASHNVWRPDFLRWQRIPSYLLAVGARTGQEIWRFELAQESDPDIRFIPSIAGNVIYCGSQKYLYALDLQTGELLWQFKTKGEVYTSPAIVDGVVYFGDDAGWLYAVR